jgi:ATP-dependent Clp protease protease subunit
MFTYHIDPRVRKSVTDLLGQEPITVVIDKIQGDIAKNLAEQIVKIRQLGQPFIPVLIDSYGGDVYTALGIRSQLLATGLPLISYCPSKAMSAAAFLTACMTRGYRYAAPAATFMIHDVSSFAVGKIQDIKVDAAEGQRLADLIFGLMDQGCGRRPGMIQRELKKRVNTDWYLTAQEALNLGLIDHIGQPEFQLETHVAFKVNGKQV